MIKKSEKEAPSILLIDEGRIDYDTLEALDKDEDWLHRELKKEGHTSVKDVFYGEWLPEGELHIYSESSAIKQEEKIDG